MYAVVKCGGKQLKVQKGDTVLVERLTAEQGETVTLTDVLLIGDGDKFTVGTPLVAGAAVSATVVEQIRDKKVVVFKKKRRHNYRRKKGHRQYLTVLKIEDIQSSGAKKAAPKKEAAKKAAPKKETAAKKPAKKADKEAS